MVQLEWGAFHLQIEVYEPCWSLLQHILVESVHSRELFCLIQHCASILGTSVRTGVSWGVEEGISAWSCIIVRRLKRAEALLEIVDSICIIFREILLTLVYVVHDSWGSMLGQNILDDFCTWLFILKRADQQFDRLTVTKWEWRRLTLSSMLFWWSANNSSPSGIMGDWLISLILSWIWRNSRSTFFLEESV